MQSMTFSNNATIIIITFSNESVQFSLFLQQTEIQIGTYYKKAKAINF